MTSALQSLAMGRTLSASAELVTTYTDEKWWRLYGRVRARMSEYSTLHMMARMLLSLSQQDGRVGSCGQEQRRVKKHGLHCHLTAAVVVNAVTVPIERQEVHPPRVGVDE